MLNLLLSNRGRIKSSQFIYGGYILILISIGLGLLEKLTANTALTMPVATFTFIGSIIVIISWTCLWIKRLHNGNQSGWLTLAFIVGYGFVLTIISTIFIVLFGDGSLLDLVMENVSGAISKDEYYKSLEAIMPKMLLPIIVARAITSLALLHFGDKILPIDPNENKYGPVPP